MQKSIYKNISLKLLAIFFTMLNIDNFNLIDDIKILPNLDIMLIFFFTICRIGIFPIWFIFVLGVWVDSLNNTPVGLSSLIYIFLIKIFLFFNYPEKNINDFKKNISIFALFLATYYILKLGLLSIYYSQIYNIYNFSIEYLISIVTYVFFSLILFKYNREDY